MAKKAPGKKPRKRKKAQKQKRLNRVMAHYVNHHPEQFFLIGELSSINTEPQRGPPEFTPDKLAIES